LFNNRTKSNACRFLNSYALKWYEVRRLKKLFTGSNCVQKFGPSYKKRRHSNAVNIWSIHILFWQVFSLCILKFNWCNSFVFIALLDRFIEKYSEIQPKKEHLKSSINGGLNKYIYKTKIYIKVCRQGRKILPFFFVFAKTKSPANFSLNINENLSMFFWYMTRKLSVVFLTNF